MCLLCKSVNWSTNTLNDIDFSGDYMKKKKNVATVHASNFTVVVKRKTKKQILSKIKWRRAIFTFKQGLKTFLHLLKKDTKLLCLLITDAVLILGTPFMLCAFKSDNFLSLIKPSYFLSPYFFVGLLVSYCIFNLIILIMQNYQKCINKKEFVIKCTSSVVYAILCVLVALNLYCIATLLAGFLVFISIKKIIDCIKFNAKMSFCIALALINFYFFAVLYAIFMLN